MMESLFPDLQSTFVREIHEKHDISDYIQPYFKFIEFIQG